MSNNELKLRTKEFCEPCYSICYSAICRRWLGLDLRIELAFSRGQETSEIAGSTGRVILVAIYATVTSLVLLELFVHPVLERKQRSHHFSDDSTSGRF